MVGTYEHAFVRDDGETEIEVAYDVPYAGYPSNGWDDAGDGPEIEVGQAVLLGTVQVVELTDGERARIETEIAENPDWWLDDGPDYD